MATRNTVTGRIAAALIVSAAPFVAVERLEAACLPLTSAAALVNNNPNVTCSGATADQNGSNGWGTANETGDTITIQTGATVTGTSAGIRIGDGTINNEGAGSTIEALNPGAAIRAENGLLTVTNKVGGIIRANTGASFGIISAGGDLTLTNFGSVEATGTGGTGIVSAFTATVNNKVGGTISGDAIGIQATTLNITNNPGATISGGITGIKGSGTAGTIDSAGSITATDPSGIAVSGGVTRLLNRSGGTITGGSNGSGVSITADNAFVNNDDFVGSTHTATISGGVDGVLIAGASGQVVSAATITGGTNSVKFTGGGNNILTLDTGSVLNGDAVGSTAAGATNKLFLSGHGKADNNFVGFNTLIMAPSSAWVLNGSSAVGTVTIQSGAGLAVGDFSHPGAVLTGDVTLGSQGELTGVATVSGGVTVNDGGKLSPGFNLGTLRVTGNVTFSAGSTLSIAATPSDASKLAVGGAATLGGATVQVFAQNSTYAPSTSYNILHADGGLGGTFSSVSTNLAFLTPSLSYAANDVTLTLVNNGGGGGGSGGEGGGGGGGAGGTGNIFATVTQTRNQTAVANALDPNAVNNPVVLALLNQTADGARQAFDALSGEVFGSVHNVQAGETQFARSAMLGRLRQASYGGYSGDLNALAFGGPELAYAGDNANAAYAANIGPAMPGKAPARSLSHMGDRSRDLTFWAQGLGGWGHTDSDGNAASLRSRFAGFLSGVDARFGDMVRAGFTAGYMRSDLNADARASSAGIDSVQIGAYAGGKLGALNVRGGASYSFDSIDVSRGIFFPGFTDQTKASFHGNVGQVFGEVGYGMTLGSVAVEPLAGLAYVHVHDNSFAESGGAAALSGASARENLGYSFLGARAATVVPLANGTALVPRASVQWQYAFGDVTPVSALAFQGTGTGFSVAGVPIARNTALVETGFDWRFSPWAKLGAFYQGELAAHAQTHAVKGGLTWNF